MKIGLKTIIKQSSLLINYNYSKKKKPFSFSLFEINF